MTKKKLFAVYNNNTLFFFLVGEYQQKSFVLFEEKISKFTIDSLNKNSLLFEIKEEIQNIFTKIQKNFDIQNKNVELLISPDSFYFKGNDFRKEFEEITVINEEDVLRLKKYAINFEEPPKGYQVIDFLIKQYYVDNKPKTSDKIIGTPALNLEINGDIIVSDKKTLLHLQDLFVSVDFKITNIHVADYFLSDKLKEDGDVIISLESHYVKFMTLNNNNINAFTVKNGTITMLEKLYEILSQQYDTQKGEELTREIKKKWILKQYPYEYDIIEGVTINSIIETTSSIVFHFFDYIFKEVKKQNINMKKISVISEDINSKELACFLNNNFDYEILEFERTQKFISGLVDAKIGYALKKICNVRR